MSSPEMGGVEHPAFATPAGQEFRGLLSVMEAHANLDTRTIFRERYESINGQATLSAYVDEPAVELGGTILGAGNIVFELDEPGRHYEVGEGSFEDDLRIRELMELIVPTQQTEMQPWLWRLYQAIDSSRESATARQFMRDAPVNVNAVFFASYRHSMGRVPTISFTRRDEFADMKSGFPTRIESRTKLSLTAHDWSLYQLNWDMVAQAVKLSIESREEWLARIDRGEYFPAFDIAVPPEDPLVLPTDQKLTAFSAAIRTFTDATPPATP